jgi:glycosyltransferase involved in cell wall biosynthesis
MESVVAPARLPISVVIPAFNRQTYIGDTLDSVLAQTALPAEILVVDDGSTDATGDVAQARGARVIRLQHGGVSAARNAGIMAAAQPWIALQDSDDLWLPEKLALQWQALRLCPDAGFAFTDSSQFNETGTIMESRFAQWPRYQGIKRVEKAPHIVCCDHESLREALVESQIMVTPSLVVKRELLIAVGMFDAGLSHGEDWELLLRLIVVASGASVERPLLRNRRLPGTPAKQWTHQMYGRLLIADRVLAQPVRYPASAPAFFANNRSKWMRRLRVQSFESGEFDAAIDAFGSCARGRRFSSANFWLICFLMLRALGATQIYRAARALRKRFRRDGTS